MTGSAKNHHKLYLINVFLYKCLERFIYTITVCLITNTAKFNLKIQFKLEAQVDYGNAFCSILESTIEKYL